MPVDDLRPFASADDRSDLFDDWNPAGGARSNSVGSLAWPPSESVARSRDGAPSAVDSDGFQLVDLIAAPGGGGDFGATRQVAVPADRVGAASGATVVTRVSNKPLAFPKLGEAIGGFRLVAELGRGAFARVYLANELGLGNRPVALKVSKAEGDEPWTLARLQHTHIMPIHSVNDDRATGLRLICMPYFGGANLAQVLDAATRASGAATAGRTLVEALDEVGRPSPDDRSTREGNPATPTAATRSGTLLPSILRQIAWWPTTGSNSSHPAKTRSNRPGGPAAIAEGPDADRSRPARLFLRQANAARASAWIVARLAEGLDHAHSRGLLHRDLKPSNILIAADGTPMLLDFNLAVETEANADAEGARAQLGGTLPYMAPEHLDAFNPKGTTSPKAVDERSDLYALGLILFEMIAGQPAFPEPPHPLELQALLDRLTAERRGPAPSIRAIVPAVTPGLDAILGRCLAPEPRQRYSTAFELAEDLRRYLDDRPLKYAPDPSLRERVGKWSRRHPRATSAWILGPLAVMLAIAVAGAVRVQADRLRQASARLSMARFLESFQECQFLLNTTNAAGSEDHLHRGIDLARATIDQFRVGRRGEWSPNAWAGPLSAEERDRIFEDFGELILLEARARVKLAESTGREAERRRALEWAVAWLDHAEKFDPDPPRALFADRSLYQKALGHAGPSQLDADRRDATPVHSARDEYLLGTADLMRGHSSEAERRLSRAVALEPNRAWAWFALGLCQFDQGQFADAAGDFGACTALMPKFAWPHSNRGLALQRAGRPQAAVEAFDRAIALDHTLSEAFVGRGLALLELNRPEAAERDLGRAVALGRHDSSVESARAEALGRLGRGEEAAAIYDRLVAERPDDPAPLAARGIARLRSSARESELDFDSALTLDPAMPLAHFGLARLRYRDEPEAALIHVDRAIVAQPRFLDAIQLRALIRARLGKPEAVDDVARLLEAPTPHRLYNAACALALLSEVRRDREIQVRAILLLRRAIEAGFPAAEARADADLASLRNHPDARDLLGH